MPRVYQISCFNVYYQKISRTKVFKGKLLVQIIAKTLVYIIVQLWFFCCVFSNSDWSFPWVDWHLKCLQWFFHKTIFSNSSRSQVWRMPEGRLYIFKRLRRHTDFLRLYYDPTKKFKLKNYNEKKNQIKWWKRTIQLMLLRRMYVLLPKRTERTQFVYP